MLNKYRASFYIFKIKQNKHEYVRFCIFKFKKQLLYFDRTC